MNIYNLNNEEFEQFGKVLDNRPKLDMMIAEQRTLESKKTTEKWCCNSPVYIDFNAGMTLLVIFRDGEEYYFYVDRVLELMPNVVFSLVSLEQTSIITLFYERGNSLAALETVAIGNIEDKLPRLGFENVLTFFCQKADAGFYFRGEAHSPFEFIYVETGTLHTIVNGHDYILNEKEGFIVGRNEWHIQYADSSVRFITVSFFADDIISNISGIKMLISDKIKNQIEQMVQEKNELLFSNDYIDALFRIILIELIRNPYSGQSMDKYPSTRLAENILVEKALRIIDNSIHNKIKLKDLADQLHISVPYLYELFSSHLHMPPGKYIMKIRIEESKILLREGEMTIGEVSQRVGFSSIQHFSKAFRKNCNMSPSEFLKTKN